MIKPKKKKAFWPLPCYPTFLAVLLLSRLFGQSTLFSQQVPGTVWKQRETTQFLLIYPENLSDEVAALSIVLDETLLDSKHLLPSKKQKKWPLVLSNQGIYSNGYVTLAPRHSFWYSTPIESAFTPSDWLMALARHEGRHMAQFDASDQGFTRLLHSLFGELGWGAGFSGGSPSWLIEGDAVVVETLNSFEGRGRDPLFTQEMLAFVLEKPGTNYFRAANPSYKNHIPDRYRLGYSLSSYIRQEHGNHSLKEIYSDAASIALPVIAFSHATKKATGKLPRILYQDMVSSLRTLAKELYSDRVWTPAKMVSTKQDSFTRYDALFEKSPGELYARRITQASSPELIRIGQDGKESVITKLPYGGRVSMALLKPLTKEEGRVKKENPPSSPLHQETEKGLLRVAWNSLRQHPVFLGADVSDLSIVDINLKGKIEKRHRGLSGTRYLYPALSPEGYRLAVVEILPSGGSALIVLSLEEGIHNNRVKSAGKILARLILPVETAAYPSWSHDGKRLVFSIQTTAGRRLAEWVIGESSPHYLIEPTWKTVKKPLYSHDKQWIYYSSNESGLEAIWGINIHQKNNTDALLNGENDLDKPYLLAQRWYGVYNPSLTVDGKGLYLSEYSSIDGESIVHVDLDPSTWIPSSTLSLPPLEEFAPALRPENIAAAERIAEKRHPAHRSQAIEKANTVYPESDYSPSVQALNFHSWGLGVNLRENTVNLGVQSQDVLNTLSLHVGGDYQYIEKSPGTFAHLTFLGIRPTLGVHASYRYRKAFTSTPFHQMILTALAHYPINFSRQGLGDHSLNIGAEIALFSNFPDTKSSVLTLPVLSYIMNWHYLRKISARAVRSDLGWAWRTSYSFTPFIKDYHHDVASELSFYLPGGFRNTSLRLGAAIEQRSDIFSPTISDARGYAWTAPGILVKTSIDYAFPFAFPDLPLGSLLFIQRLRAEIFSDFSFSGARDDLWNNPSLLDQHWSTGLSLNMDFTVLNLPLDWSMGIRFSWLWNIKKPRFDLLLLDVPF